jgi:DNA phosphorothioation-associated putative methyltransferase
LNVIDDPDERREVIASAWKLSKRMLLISARLEHEQDDAHVVPRGDGWITSSGTFQKFFAHSELGDLIGSVTGTEIDAVGPGIFAIFRTVADRQAWMARRMRSPVSPRLAPKSSVLLTSQKKILEPLIDFVLERGRLPQGDELDAFLPAVEQFGSVKAAFQVVIRATDREEWKHAAMVRSIDVLAFLALAQFDGVDRMGLLTSELQRDVRAHFGSFKAAHEKAIRLLYSSGDARSVDLACRASGIGKLTPTALYLHSSGISELPALLRVVLGCGQRLVGEIPEANVLKIFRTQPKISYLQYPTFDEDPHPWLDRGWVLDLHEQSFKTSSFGHRENRPILHRIHEFLPATDPRHEEIRSLTESEERAGLYAQPSTIGTEAGWSAALAHADGAALT